MLNKNDYNDKKIKIIMITCEIFVFFIIFRVLYCIYFHPCNINSLKVQKAEKQTRFR